MSYIELPNVPPRSLVTSESTVPIHFAHIAHDGGQVDIPPAQHIAFILGLSADIPFRSDFGDGWSEIHYRSGDMFLVPDDTAICVECGGACTALHAVMPVEPVASYLEEDGHDPKAALTPLYGSIFYDDGVRSTILRMWRQALRGDHHDALLHDALLEAFLSSLLANADTRPIRLSNKLTDAELGRITEYCVEYLDDELRVERLGRLVGMSEAHFTRSFRRTTGESPYQFVLRLRLSQACELLVHPEVPIAEIAYSCGFSSQSHLTDLFRARIGVSPAQYRFDLLGV